MVEAVAENDEADGEVPGGRGAHHEELKAAIRKETIANTWFPLSAVLPTRTTAFRSCWMPLLTTCPLRPMSRTSRV